jgi:dTDP-4-dehydrorhamnose 3,5-epimerase
MKVIPTKIKGLVVIEPAVFEDKRGFFIESFHEEKFAAAGLPSHFVQDNHSHSVPGTLRGLHYQMRKPQGKLVRCIRGAIYDVAVDIRRGSPTFGHWVGVDLTEENRLQLYIPPGFAHGFCAPVSSSDLMYKCTALYDPSDEKGVAWNDPLIGIKWPIASPLLSEKDSRYAPLTPDREDLPAYEGEPQGAAQNG